MTISEKILNIQLYFKGKTYKLNKVFRVDETIDDVSKYCSDHLAIPIDNYKALYKGKSLNRYEKLSRLEIGKDDIINIVCFEKPQLNDAEIVGKFSSSASTLSNQVKESIPSLLLHKKLLFQLKEVVDYMETHPYEREAYKYKSYLSLIKTLDSLQGSFKSINSKLKAKIQNKPENEQESGLSGDFASQIGNLVSSGLKLAENLFQTNGTFSNVQTSSSTIAFQEPNLLLKNKLKDVFRHTRFDEATPLRQIVNENKNVVLETLCEDLFNGGLEFVGRIIGARIPEFQQTYDKLQTQLKDGKIQTQTFMKLYFFLQIDNKILRNPNTVKEKVCNYILDTTENLEEIKWIKKFVNIFLIIIFGDYQSNAEFMLKIFDHIGKIL